ncbi:MULTISPECIES: hypothetical protein [unclassified Pseudoalteromonas]|uniref:hypothetical protein n=1 Tax=unclassified Pseudoalteromonas TaxID=194690 RepID=UPI0005A8F2BC|nr:MULTISPECIES: hypothetical protein [unclassified Pseudoalteromonas]
MGDKKYSYCSGKSRIDVSCQKVGRMWTQTPPEAAYALMLDNDPEIKTFATQPAKFKFNGQTYQPDFLVEYHDGRKKFIEVHSRKYQSEEFEERIESFEKAVDEKFGAEFDLIFNDEIDQTYVRNIEHLFQYSRLTETDINKIIRYAWYLPEKLRLAEAEQYLKEQMGSGFSIRVLMLLGLYDFDWYKKIDEHTQITRAVM